MGASFRKKEQVLALCGCDRLTISPAILDELTADDQPVSRKLTATSNQNAARPAAMMEDEFRWQHNSDAMAVEKP